MSAARTPTTLLIAALGGQGGGVLAGWIGAAARAEGLVVQATSTPGVSQRTGATTYYVELGPAPLPPLALAPVPGRVDVLVCAELLEAARMAERGMCTPSRTLVIASTHRVYTTREKMSGDDGRYDGARVRDAIVALSRRAVLFDMEAVRARHRAAISAVLFGALAGSGALPLSRAACEQAIRSAGIGVAPSLAAFGDAYARSAAGIGDADAAGRKVATGASLPGAAAARARELPAWVADLALEGVARLTDYQDEHYASIFVERVGRIVAAAAPHGAGAHAAVREGVRRLARWMAYDDAIRVAQVKASAARLAQVARAAGARDGDIVRVREMLHPGAAEIAAILPAGVGAWLERRARARPRRTARGRGLALETTSASGALALRLVAALRPWRRRSLRYAREQAAIERWLARFERALAEGPAARNDDAMALARLPRLLGGYGATHADGCAAFDDALAARR